MSISNTAELVTDAAREARKEAKKYKRHLTTLTLQVKAYLAHLDVAMTKPANNERGREIARLSNGLEMENDRARYFGLGVDFRKDAKLGGRR